MPDCNSLNMLSNSGDNLSANVFRNSAGKPSGPGHFPFCIDIRAHLISPAVKGLSNSEYVSGPVEGVFECVSSDELSEVYNKE